MNFNNLFTSLFRDLLLFSALPFLFLISHRAAAQAGVYAAWNQLQFKEKNDQNTDQYVSLSGITAGIDYWFRLRNVRVEFKPGLAYTRLKAEDQPTLFQSAETEWWHLVISGRVYPLSFYDDCKCPTFSKRSGFFKDGFFLSVTPQLIRSESTTQLAQPEFRQIDHSEFSLLIDVGAGLDIGLSDQFTLTPEVRLRYSPNTVIYSQWGGMNVTEDTPISGRVTGLFASIGITYLWID